MALRGRSAVRRTGLVRSRGRICRLAVIHAQPLLPLERYAGGVVSRRSMMSPHPHEGPLPDGAWAPTRRHRHPEVAKGMPLHTRKSEAFRGPLQDCKGELDALT
jgi:hypothetical protein